MLSCFEFHFYNKLDSLRKLPTMFNLYPEFLEIKRDDLAVEAKNIRKLENFAKTAARFGFQKERNYGLISSAHYHRIFDIRKEQRSTLIAIGFLKGKKYRQIERLAYDQPDWDRIERLIMKYGAADIDQRQLAQSFAEWKSEALAGEKPDSTEACKARQPGAHRRRLTRWMYLARQELAHQQLEKQHQPAE